MKSLMELMSEIQSLDAQYPDLADDQVYAEYISKRNAIFALIRAGQYSDKPAARF